MKVLLTKKVRGALDDMLSHIAKEESAQVAYVNPQTSQECLPILGFSALALRPGETFSPKRRSASQVFHVIEGEALIDGGELNWSES
jgi:gentisate 1,2-dioxygenase